MTETKTNPKPKPHPFLDHSLLGRSAEIDEATPEDVHVLGRIALRGQSTVVYAPPNTGKTLIILALLCNALDDKLINGMRTFYLNMDDSAAGLVDKLYLADTQGFHVVAEGYEGFKASQLAKLIDTVIERGQAGETVIILDTLKKFVNVMDKSAVTAFTANVRRFVMKGGTVLALAHTNKRPGMDGKAIYGGTSDVVDDFDCAYMLTEVPDRADGDQKVVVFKNFKARGNVVKEVGYTYLSGESTSYIDRLQSVRELDPKELVPIQRAAETSMDEPAIAAVIEAIGKGDNMKMVLTGAICNATKMSRREALSVLDRYTGEDPNVHRWSYKVVSRGGKEYALLTPPAAPTSEIQPA